MSTVTVEAILTTTQPNGAYGGIQLGRQILEDLAESVLDGRLPLTRDHDVRRPVKATVLDSGVRDREDGYEEAWALIEIEEAQWSRWQDELRQLGVPGGFSFSMMTEVATINSASEAAPGVLSVAADPSHFDDEAIIDAAHHLAPAGSVEARRLYQFSAQHPARVVLEYSAAVLMSVPPGLLSNYIFEMARSFLRLPGRQGNPTIFEFVVSETESERKVTGHLETASVEVAKAAIFAFRELASRQGTYEYTAEGRWQQVGAGHEPGGQSEDDDDGGT